MMITPTTTQILIFLFTITPEMSEVHCYYNFLLLGIPQQLQKFDWLTSVTMGGVPVSRRGITTAPKNVMARSDRLEPVVLYCENSITWYGTYPRWTYSRNGINFTAVTDSDCSLSSQNSLRGVTCQRSRGSSGSMCNITIASAYVSENTGVFTCTYSNSASAVVTYIESSIATNKDHNPTEVVKGDSITVTCRHYLRQAPSPAPQIRLSVQLSSSEHEYIPKAPGSTFSTSMLFTRASSEVILPYTCKLNFSFAGMGASGFDTSSPKDITLRTMPLAVLFWPETRTMTVMGDVDGKMPPNGLLTCHAPANPPPTYEWIDVASGYTSRGPTIHVSHDGTYICTATNMIIRQIYNASKSITVQVELEHRNRGWTSVDGKHGNPVLTTVLVILGTAVLLLVAVVACAWRKITRLGASVDRKVKGNVATCGNPEIRKNDYFMPSTTEANEDVEMEIYENATPNQPLPNNTNRKEREKTTINRKGDGNATRNDYFVQSATDANEDSDQDSYENVP